jgi:uncharacterized membrane protein YczE
MVTDMSANGMPAGAGRVRRALLIPGDHLAARLVRLYAGLAGFGVSLALMLRARLGLGPWDVLHQGIARHLGVQIGWVSIAVSGLVLVAWIPLRQRPGLGTISNAVIVGLVVNGALDVLPAPRALAWRIAWLAAGIGLNALATACYIGAGLGPGPRDGLMTGLAARGYSLRLVRTLIELSALAAGIALSGSFGPGTVAYALSIGPLTQVLLPRLTVRPPPGENETSENKPGESETGEDKKGTRSHDGTDLRSRHSRLGRAGRRPGRPGPGGRAARLRLRLGRRPSGRRQPQL